MPQPFDLELLKQALAAGAGTVRETYPEYRNAIAEALLQPGGKGSETTTKDYFHTQGSRALTKKLGTLFPPEAAAGVADGLYGLNETMTGGLASIAGKPFFSEYGYNVADLFRNKKGQDQAVQELKREADPEMYADIARIKRAPK